MGLRTNNPFYRTNDPFGEGNSQVGADLPTEGADIDNIFQETETTLKGGFFENWFIWPLNPLSGTMEVARRGYNREVVPSEDDRAFPPNDLV